MIFTFVSTADKSMLAKPDIAYQTSELATGRVSES